MSYEWRSASLIELVSDLLDHRGRTPKKLGGDFSSSGVPVISAKNIRDGRLDLTFKPRLVSEEMFDRWMPKKLKRGDVLLTSEAPMGEAAYLNGEYRYCLGQRLFALRPRPERLDGRFLYFSLRSPMVQARLYARLSGTTAQGIRQSELVKVELDIPPLAEQRRIAGVLGALDDKIENSRKTASRAGELAQHEFVRWLATQADAPRVVVSELTTVGALVVGDGYRAKNSEMADEGLAFIRGRNVGEDIDMQSADLLGWDGVRRAGEKRSQIGDVFFTAKGTVGRVGRVSQWSREFVYSPQLAFWRTLNADVIHPDFLYLWICSKEFLQQRDSVKGQTDMADYVNLRDQREMKITLPDSAEQRKLAAAATPLLDTQSLLLAEAKTLATIRDLLLPRLISGQIRVSESYDPDDVLGTVAEEAGAAV
jgi:type I restriction enzyme, S subunit